MRWIAVVVGFIGVLVATDPFGSGMKLSLPVWLALQAAVFWAFSTVLLRKTAMQEVTLVQMTLSSGFFILFTGIAVVVTWVPPSLIDVALMVGTGLIAGIAQYALFEGMRRAPVSDAGAVRIFLAALGLRARLLIWGDMPGNPRFCRRGADLFRRHDHHSG